MSNPLAKKTIRRITEALEKNETGSVGEIVNTVRRLSGRIAHVSIEELAEIIGQDTTIMERVISAANTFAFNPTGVEIITISQAIHTVGFERIRNLTLSLMLADGAGKSLNNEEQKEMAAISVCSGMLSQTLVGNSSLMGADPEAAFVGASLRNYGKLLMSTFFADEFSAAKYQATAQSSDQAYIDIFGITPLALGQILLKSTNLPEIVLASLERIPQEKFTRSAQNEEEEILMTAEMSVRVCEIAFDPNISPEQFEREISKTIQTFSDSLPVDFDAVRDALSSVEEFMAQLNQIIGIKNDASVATRKLGARIKGDALPKPRPVKKRPANANRSQSIGLPDNAEYESLDDVLSKIEKLRNSGDPVDLGEIYESINAAIVGALKLEGCMTFICDDPDECDLRYSARHGIGKLYDRIKNRPLISSDKKDLFSICLNRKEDILIQDTNAGKISSVIPEWIHFVGNVTSMIVLPTTLEKNLFAIFVGTISKGAALDVDKESLGQLRQFRIDLADLKKHAESAKLIKQS